MASIAEQLRSMGTTVAQQAANTIDNQEKTINALEVEVAELHAQIDTMVALAGVEQADVQTITTT